MESQNNKPHRAAKEKEKNKKKNTTGRFHSALFHLPTLPKVT